jgi:N-methylhydantoinase A/oxoprolinase/acetone carboxylase beta subunit
VRGTTGEAVCVRRAPDLAALKSQLEAVAGAGISSLAVVLKHAAIFPDHEVAVGRLAREMGFKQVGGILEAWQQARGAGGSAAGAGPRSEQRSRRRVPPPPWTL